MMEPPLKFESRVIEIIQRTKDVLSIRFEKPSLLEYHPGQYMFVELMIEGVKSRKHFSLSSSPTERRFIEITKRLTGHVFSNALTQLKVGDTVSLEAPFGLFTLNNDHEKILFLTGGIGITPIHSMIRFASDMNLKTDMVLLYSCRNQDNIPFRDELDQLQSVNQRFKVVHTLTRPEGDWHGLVGRINSEMIRKVVPDFLKRVSYISGPTEMVNNILNMLTAELSVPKSQVKFEYFPGFNIDGNKSPQI
jgi:ferredoxin-NADP reductase